MKLLYTDETESPFGLEFFEILSRAVSAGTGAIIGEGCEISLLITDDETVRELNRNFRGKDKATDVLSFPMGEDDMLGDIVISADTAKRQAAEAGIPLERETAFLYIHGMLHLLGYDHETGPEEEREMFALQEDILRGLVESGRIK